MLTLRKRTVFYPCPAHVSRYACETRQRRAECFVEGGWCSPCKDRPCAMKPGTDYYSPEFVVNNPLYVVGETFAAGDRVTITGPYFTGEVVELVGLYEHSEWIGREWVVRRDDGSEMAVQRCNLAASVEPAPASWAYVVETLNPRSTARTANGRDLENYERRMRAGGRPDYDVQHARATSSMALVPFIIVNGQPLHLLGGKGAAWMSGAIHALPETGGEVALPDGFVLRVRRVNRYALAGDVAEATGEPCRVGDAIDRFNALQEG